jgi:hypothetical protein
MWWLIVAMVIVRDQAKVTSFMKYIRIMVGDGCIPGQPASSSLIFDR